MNSQRSLLLTLLRKDLRLFGPFAALIGGLLALQQFTNLVALLGQLGNLLQMGLELGTLLLILAVCYEDAIVSLKHDWLTRPVPGPILLLAKILFVFLATILPAILGAFLYNLTQGSSLAEAVLAGVSSGAAGNTLLPSAMAMAFAAVTANIRQAVIVFLASLATIVIVTLSWSLFNEPPESPGATGSAWVLQRSMELLLTAGSIAVLWIQYRHRNTRVARVVATVAVVGSAAIVTFVTWTPVFAIQKMLSPDPGAAASVQVATAQGCFPARVLESAPAAVNDASARLTAVRYSEEHRKSAGPGATAFSTRLLAQPVAAGEMLTVNHVELSYFSAGQELRRLRPGLASFQRMAPIDGQPAADHYWLLPDADAKRLASTPGVETRLKYSLSLLAPKSSAKFLADGHRSYYSGVGFCGAKFDRAAGVVVVNCFRPGAQPARLTASLESADEATMTSRRVGLVPAWLDFWGGTRHTMSLVARGAEVPRVTVTAYEARVHFDRQIVVPGVLGGPTLSCPLPSAP